jgi:copper chaperone CopZ
VRHRHGREILQTERVTLEIYGLGSGGSGALVVERALARVKGVVHAYANPSTETAYVQYDPAFVQPADLVQAIEAAGFRAGAPIRR